MQTAPGRSGRFGSGSSGRLITVLVGRNSREAVMGKMAIFLFGFLALAIVIGALGTISPV